MIRQTLLAFALMAGTAQAQELSSFRTPEDCGLYRYKAIIKRVYDGDTVWADIDLGFHTWRHDESLRLYGIDTPEVRGEERPEGLKARDALRKRIDGKELIICTIKDEQGKFGRFLAILWDGEENLNEWLLKEGYAEPYD
ncbi:thermonuclease family protein [Jiella marina]|uniref:thermonuclease family protein n=1 Tax=Jiella sp. LLJ827 TaxID=2917712 RepID=UPI002100B1EA|nr:thermonuclease family protein [Jiella sp. LLJ827]MCQ0987562.1 thermonuclease family protein [Jiella sp. LLJ827]